MPSLNQNNTCSAQASALRYALGPAARGVGHLALALLLDELPFRVLLLKIRARAALAHARAAARCPRRRALDAAVRDETGATAFSCVAAAHAACRELGLVSPSAGDDPSDWKCAVSLAVRRYDVGLAAAGSLRLFRAVDAPRAWRRKWILDQRASADTPGSWLVAVLGGASRLTPHVRLAHIGRQQPGYCDFCRPGSLTYVGGRADVVHICLACPYFDGPRVDWFRRLDAAAVASNNVTVLAWWSTTRAAVLASPSDAGFAACLVAAGAPSLPAGVLAELRDAFTAAFVDSFCGCFIRYHATAAL